MPSKLIRWFNSNQDRAARFSTGLALFAAGLALLAVHFFAHSTSNILLVAAILLEISGLVLHFRKILH